MTNAGVAPGVGHAARRPGVEVRAQHHKFVRPFPAANLRDHVLLLGGAARRQRRWSYPSSSRFDLVGARVAECRRRPSRGSIHGPPSRWRARRSHRGGANCSASPGEGPSAAATILGLACAHAEASTHRTRLPVWPRRRRVCATEGRTPADSAGPRRGDAANPPCHKGAQQSATGAKTFVRPNL